MVKERLRDWKELAGVNERFPTRMLFYRDGVGEDQYSAVESAEILDIEKAYRDLTGQEPQLTFVVVTKRHHTRFFPRHPRDTTLRPHEFNPSTKTLENNGNTNLAPGLLVDRVITAPRATPSPDSILPRDGVCPSNYDFYLQSHQAIKGTARSAHYTVLKNSANFTVGQVQNLVSTQKTLRHGTNSCSRLIHSATHMPVRPKVFHIVHQLTMPTAFVHVAVFIWQGAASRMALSNCKGRTKGTMIGLMITQLRLPTTQCGADQPTGHFKMKPTGRILGAHVWTASCSTCNLTRRIHLHFIR